MCFDKWCKLFLISPLIIVLPLLGCGVKAGQYRSRRSESAPKVIGPQGLDGIIHALPDYAIFTFSGMGFFHGKLYVSSNVGVLEVEGANVRRLYKWSDSNDVVSGPWYDRVNKKLWFYHRGLNKLISYDNKRWEAVDLPIPKEGYTREEILRGPVGMSNADNFWIQVGYYAWRWDDKGGRWVNEPQPKRGVFFSIAPFDKELLFIMRRDPIPLSGPPEQSNSDVVFTSQGDVWREVPNKTGLSFFTDTVTSTDEAAFVLTENRKLLRLTSGDITLMETPSGCEAMAASSSGNLIASFRNSGIYEYAGEWRLKYPPPYPLAQDDHRIYLTESDGRVAFAITPKAAFPPGSNRRIGAPVLWVSEGSRWVQAKIDGNVAGITSGLIFP